MHGVNASEDEVVTRNLRQRRIAFELQQQVQTGIGQRWDDLTRSHGLERPTSVRPQQVALARMDRNPPHSPAVAAMNVRYGMEPTRLKRDIDGIWPDTQDGQWLTASMHDSVYNSRFYSLDYKHYLLTTNQEGYANPGCVPTATEISWLVDDYLYSGFTRSWIPTTLPVVAFLQRINMLQGCNMAYRCDIYHNGRRVTTTRMYMTEGDFIHVRATLQPPPDDTESETPSPMPIMQATGSVSSSPTSSETETPTPGDYLAEGSVTDIWIIYRPPVIRHRSLQLIATVTQEDLASLTRVTQHWQDLRYQTWHLQPVHQAYERDFPPSDFTHHFVLVTMADLPSPLHQVSLFVVHTPVNMLIKAQVMIPVIERTIILMFARLEHFCRDEPARCRVYHNGQLLSEGQQRHVRNGDYVRLTLNVAPGPTTAALMAQEFEVVPDVAGFEYCEEGTLAILTGPNADAIPLVELRSGPQEPNDQMTADWYWILLGFYTTFILIVTVRIFDPPKRRRQVRRHSHTRTKGYRSQDDSDYLPADVATLSNCGCPADLQQSKHRSENRHKDVYRI